MDNLEIYKGSAVEDYYTARRRAKISDLLTRFTGKRADLLSYEEIRHKLKIQTVIDRGTQDIPLASIVGSVNRYQDFTQGFLPRQSITKDRWVRVEIAAVQLGLPPIDVYQIGQVYFVKDGNHRVAVARQLGWRKIEAHIEEVLTDVSFTPEMDPDALILKAEYAGFLAFTNLHKARPDARLELTAPGQYPKLEKHIAAHRHSQDVDQSRSRKIEEIVADWYDTVYQPTAQYIEESGILREFPGRMATDLYLWIVEHQEALEAEYHRPISSPAAARDLVERFSRRPKRIFSRLGRKIKKTLFRSRYAPWSAVGEWRREKQAESIKQHLFSDILTAVSGSQESWVAVHQAIDMARREGAHVHGIHVLRDEAQKESPQSQAIQAQFNQLCENAGVSGHFIFTVGDVAERILEYSRWSDLLVVNLTYPSNRRPFAELSPALRSLVQRCSRPVLVVPRRAAPINRLLLAYDGSPKSREALFVAAYLASAWNLSLAVITAFENERVLPETLAEAWQYLEEHGVDATYIKASGPIAQEMIITLDELSCDLILMGGYGHRSIQGSVLGSTVERVLREARKPALICR